MVPFKIVLSELFGISNHYNTQVAFALIFCSHLFQQALLFCVTPAGNKSIAEIRAWRWSNEHLIAHHQLSGQTNICQHLFVFCSFVFQFCCGPGRPSIKYPYFGNTYRYLQACGDLSIDVALFLEACIPAVWPRLLITALQQKSFKLFGVDIGKPLHGRNYFVWYSDLFLIEQ